MMPNASKSLSRSLVVSAAGLICFLLVLIALISVSLPVQAQSRRETAASELVMPHYEQTGALKLPDTYRRWVFVGSSLGLSYTQGSPGMEMFHETLMEPTAYEHFIETGTFREGSMFALLLHGTGEGVMPARTGRFAAELHGVEIAVKDTAHRREGWAYYNFGGVNGIRDTAQAMPKESCYNCHAQHAKRDNVFLQFYSLLQDPPLAVAANSVAARLAAHGDIRAVETSQPSAHSSLAVKGFDPVLLVSGREEMGKPEIIAIHKGYRYQFVSEPNRARFESDPQKYSIQNDSCLVVRGAPIDPALFAVHDGRIYAFATADCVQQFERDPLKYVKP